MGYQIDGKQEERHPDRPLSTRPLFKFPMALPHVIFLALVVIMVGWSGECMARMMGMFFALYVACSQMFRVVFP